MTARETILLALRDRLSSIADVRVVRNEVLPEKVPPGGLIILRDGDAGEPEVTLSPVTYFWQYRATLDVLISGQDIDTRLDNLFAAIAAAVEDEPTFGGLCDMAIPLAPETSALGVEGAPHIKAAIVPIELYFTTTSQLG